MNNSSFAPLKLRVHLETFIKQSTIENGKNLLREIEKLEGENNFQFIQDFALSRLLIILDSLQ